MADVSFSGIGSGIDWKQVINYEIATYRQRMIKPLKDQKDSYQTRLDLFNTLEGKLKDLLSAAEAMDTPEELKAYAASSSNEDVVSATATSSANEGSHTVLVNQLARPEIEVHSGLDDDDTIVNNSGSTQTLALTYGTASFSVNVPTGTTLSELASLINNAPDNPGITASILNDGLGTHTSYHLVLTGNDTGASHTITIDSAGTTLQGEWGNLTSDALAGSSSVTVDDATPFAQYQAVIVDDGDSIAEYHIIDSIAGNTLTLQGTTASDFTVAQNAYVTPRGVGSDVPSGATSGSTQITVSDASVFQVGKTVIIADGTANEQLTVTAVDTSANTITVSTPLTNSYSAGAYVTQLEGGRKFTFESTDFTETQSAANAQIRVDGYPSTGWIERESNTITDAITGVTLELKSTSPSTVTITINPDIESVKSKIHDFVDAYNDVKTFINQNASYDEATSTAGPLLGNYAVDMVESTLRDIVISPAAGFQDGTDSYTVLGHIGIESTVTGGDKDSLGTLTVDDSKLEDALAADFEGAIELLAAAFSGASDSTYLTFYQASSTLTTPGMYDVEVDFDASGNITAARMKLTTESTFRSATVNAPYVIGTSGNPEDGLWVKAEWDGVSTTQSAVVRVKQGIAGAIADAIEEMTDFQDGIITNVKDSYKDTVDGLEEAIRKEEERLELIRERLTRQYAQVETYLASLKGLSSWASTWLNNSQGNQNGS